VAEKRRPTILIVDDQPEVLQVFSRALDQVGYNTQIAETAESALELVEALPPDAVLLDLRMPYVNGMGFLYRLRERHPQMPVAIITGVPDLDEATVEEIRALGAAVHFKPLSIAEVQTIAAALLSTRTTRAGK
jgi:DNA-binding NtrC family response regulator